MISWDLLDDQVRSDGIVDKISLMVTCYQLDVRLSDQLGDLIR